MMNSIKHSNPSLGLKSWIQNFRFQSYIIYTLHLNYVIDSIHISRTHYEKKGVL